MTLHVEQVVYAWPGGPVVIDDLTAAYRPACVTAIIGPNAVGKTTLLRLMLGLLRPQRGRITFQGAAVHDLSPVRRAAMLAYVAQRPRVDAPFHVREVVELGRYAVGPARAAVEEALLDCDLIRYADRPYHELSVGQQQRVALARALAQISGREDAALLLDEPTAAMDPRHIQRTARILRGAAARGLTVVVVLHDLIQAAHLADEVLILHDGRAAAHGPVEAVLNVELLQRVYGVEFQRLNGAEAGGRGAVIPVLEGHAQAD